MDLKDLGEIHSQTGINKILVENEKKLQRQAVRRSAELSDMSAERFRHQQQEKDEKTYRDEKQIKLLTKILESSSKADQKTDYMLFAVIITGGITCLDIIFN